MTPDPSFSPYPNYPIELSFVFENSFRQTPNKHICSVLFILAYISSPAPPPPPPHKEKAKTRTLKVKLFAPMKKVQLRVARNPLKKFTRALHILSMKSLKIIHCLLQIALFSPHDFLSARAVLTLARALLFESEPM